MALYVLLYWNSFWPWDSIGQRPFLYGLGLCHTTAMVVPWIPSIVYHLFMSHQGGELVYNSLLKIDVIGIFMTECFGNNLNCFLLLPDRDYGTHMMFFPGVRPGISLNFLRNFNPGIRRCVPGSNYTNFRLLFFTLAQMFSIFFTKLLFEYSRYILLLK